MWALTARDPVFLPEHLEALRQALPTEGPASWSVSPEDELVMVKLDAAGAVSDISSFPANVLSPSRGTDLVRYAAFARGWARAMEAGGCWALMRLLDVASLDGEDGFFRALQDADARHGAVHRAWADTIAQEHGAACLDDVGASVLGAFGDAWDSPKHAFRALSEAYRRAEARRASGPASEDVALARLLLPLAESMMKARSDGPRAFVMIDGVNEDSELLLVRTACDFLEVVLGGDAPRVQALGALRSKHG